eukprot:scaffold973_cov399-Prasinococcus_capsulatus_cf.AAC.5
MSTDQPVGLALAGTASIRMTTAISVGVALADYTPDSDVHAAAQTTGPHQRTWRGEFAVWRPLPEAGPHICEAAGRAFLLASSILRQYAWCSSLPPCVA